MNIPGINVDTLRKAGYTIEYDAYHYTVRLNGRFISSAGTKREKSLRGRAATSNREYFYEMGLREADRHYRNAQKNPRNRV